jgi:hypothetical protein
MNVAELLTFWTVGVVIAGVVAYVAAHQFSPEARERRRCRRNHRRVISRARRPMVMLSARVPRS